MIISARDNALYDFWFIFKKLFENKKIRARILAKWPYSRANFQKFLFKIFAREYSHFANIRARIFKNLRFFDGFQRTLRMWWRGDSMRDNFFFPLHMISFNHPWTYFVKKTWIRLWKFFAKMYKLFAYLGSMLRHSISFPITFLMEIFQEWLVKAR